MSDGIDSRSDVPSVDTPPTDTPADSGMCTADIDCADTTFCNGAERCMPGAAGADTRGCIAGGPPCVSSQTCNEARQRCDSMCDVAGDADSDGHRSASCGGDDCDDADSNRFPGNAEVCDTSGHDEDCDTATFGFRDADMDGEPDARCCNMVPGGMPICGSDCDDNRPTVNPTSPEVCNGRDDNCDGTVDEGVRVTYYIDGDNDGFGSAASGAMTLVACSQPAGYAATNTDCDDSVAAMHPGAPDVCDTMNIDDDCDGTPNNPPRGCSCTGTASRPCTAQGVCASGTESCIGGAWSMCSIGPQPELCNGQDDDCDGAVDNGVRVTCYQDGDNDGYAPGGAISSAECPVVGRDTVGGCPVNFTNRAPTGTLIDCDDSLAMVSPSAVESCNMRDDDCDSMIDDGVGVTCYADPDLDGYAIRGASATALCPVAGGGCPVGYTARVPADALTSDCIEMNGTVYPGAPDACGDMLDNDCDGRVDNGLLITCYVDVDDDGYPAAGAAMSSECPAPGRMGVGGCPPNTTNRDPATTTNRDCNDSDPATYPGAVEICDAVDQNCNGRTDDAVRVTCWVDGDDDTYAAVGATSSTYCPEAGRSQVGGCPINRTNRDPSVAGNADCNDTPTTGTAFNPGVVETCQTTAPCVDNNCNGCADEPMPCYRDSDRDGYGVSTIVSYACSGTCPSGSTLRAPTSGNADCDDTSTSVNPGHADDSGTCNCVDNNCDGIVDNTCQTSRRQYTDSDGDGYGGSSFITVTRSSACPAAFGYSYATGDCDDHYFLAHPGQTRFGRGWIRCPMGGYACAPNTATSTGCSSISENQCVSSMMYVNSTGTCMGTGTIPTGTLEFDYDCNGVAEPSPSATNADCDQTTPCFSNITMGCGANMGAGGCGDIVGGRSLFVYSGTPPACGSPVTRHTCTSGTCPGACTVAGTFGGTEPFQCR